jgi:hypothetical protein
MATEADNKNEHPENDPGKDGRERLKNINTLEEYYDLTNTKGHSAKDPLDFKDINQPQDKDKKPQDKEE